MPYSRRLPSGDGERVARLISQGPDLHLGLAAADRVLQVEHRQRSKADAAIARFALQAGSASAAAALAAADAADAGDRHVHLRDRRDDCSRSEKRTYAQRHPYKPANSRTHVWSLPLLTSAGNLAHVLVVDKRTNF